MPERKIAEINQARCEYYPSRDVESCIDCANSLTGGCGENAIYNPGGGELIVDSEKCLDSCASQEVPPCVGACNYDAISIQER
jgi:Fe-S-cluster-containing hydrogenase component 2